MAKYRNVVSPSAYGPIIINRYDKVIGLAVSVRGSWEKEQIDLIRSKLLACTTAESAITILDVGANIGTHTLAFAQFPFKQVTVHAFEAQRSVYYMLAGSVALNSLDHVYCHHKAVSDRSGESITIPRLDYDSPANFGGVELEAAVNPDFKGVALAGQFESIATARLDDYDYENLRLIKIDVEGMEHKVLAGAAGTINRHRPLMFIEYGKTDFTELARLLREQRYASYFIPGENIFCIPAELDLTIEGASRVEA
jgi:FkbM family methyltransferase